MAGRYHEAVHVERTHEAEGLVVSEEVRLDEAIALPPPPPAAPPPRSRLRLVGLVDADDLLRGEHTRAYALPELEPLLKRPLRREALQNLPPRTVIR